MSDLIRIPLSGGQSLTLYEARPASGKGPGVIVLHAWWGLNDFFKTVCDRLAREGFFTIAPDLYQGKVASTPQEAETLMDSFPSGSFEQATEAAADYLRLHSGVQGQPLGVIGFSMGVPLALQLSAQKPDEVAAVVAFYGTGMADFSHARAAYQGHFARVDEWEPEAYVQQLEQELRAAGRPVTFYMYPEVGHWFFENNRPDNFHAESAALAWERLSAFLHANLDAGRREKPSA